MAGTRPFPGPAAAQDSKMKCFRRPIADGVVLGVDVHGFASLSFSAWQKYREARAFFLGLQADSRYISPHALLLTCPWACSIVLSCRFSRFEICIAGANVSHHILPQCGIPLRSGGKWIQNDTLLRSNRSYTIYTTSQHRVRECPLLPHSLICRDSNGLAQALSHSML
jgi:hypothetical protein